MTPEEKEKYIQELEQLVTARTEQLRTALVTQERVKAVLIEAQTARSLTDAKSAIDRAFAELGRLGMCATENNQPPQFGGAPGTPVPQVDLDDIKASLQLTREVEKRHPEGRCQVGASLAASVCKPGADIQAIGFRLSQLGVIELLAKFGSIAPDTVNSLKRDGEFTDQVLGVIATMPLTWMEPGVTQGLPFDWEQFLQLCAA
jgi:hypothetical protein